MLKALVPVDGSENSNRAIKHVIGLIQGREPMEVLLLNVEEPIKAWEIRKFMTDEEVELMQYARGEEQLQAAKSLLDKEGISYRTEVVIGEIAETICRIARERGFDKIVMGTRGLGAIQNLLLGSIATKVIHLSDVPVTLVK